MADYNISAEITADASGFESGVKKAEKASKNLSKSLSGVIQGLGKNGLVGALGAVGLASSGLTSTLGAVIKIGRKVSETMTDLTNSYKTQLIAERQLDTAIQNNPFVTGASANALKQFASEMQKVSNYGDEELIPMMANLVSLGRTEAETMQIMSVAMDMSAGMGISLDTAITQLNATLNGNIGRLGQQNAELKDLTEEELKQGKAIEILGEKFKGLSSATADTSKQLKNIKSDFKEALGQFTLPSSDMWNRFWAGFYSQGISVINKFNDYLDASIIGKNIFKQMTSNADIVAQAQGVSREDVLSDLRYLKEQLKTLNDEELKSYLNYLSNLKERTQAEERQLTIARQILQARGLQEVQDKKDAEILAQKVKLQEEEEKKEIELSQLREKELKLENEWSDKLFAIRLESLEKQRDRELDNEKLTQEEKLKIYDFYSDQILTMKIKQLEKERDEALAQDNLTEESRRSINLYYENKITNAKKEEADKRLKIKKKSTEEEIKDEKLKFAEMLKVAGEYTKKLAETFKNVAKKIASTVKNVISTVGNIFTKIFEFNPDEALNNLLKFEDSVLTFFVETLPKLPQFFESAISSIIHTIQQVLSIIDFDAIADIIGFIANGLLNLITNISKMINSNSDKITKGFIKIVKTVIEGLADWVTSGGWKEFLDLLLTLQTAIEDAVVENIEAFAETVAKMLPDLVNTLIKSIVSASRTFGKIAKTLLPLIAKIINAIVKVITSNEVVEASIEAVGGLIEGLIPAIVDILVNALPRIINFFIVKLPSYTPQLIVGIINALINAFSNMDFGELVSAFFDGFIDGFANFGNTNGLGEGISKLFKKIFTLDFWLDALGNLAKAFGELLLNAIKGLDITNLLGLGGSSGGGGGGGGSSFDPVDLFDPIGVRHWFGFANGSNSVPSGLALVGEAGPELVKFRGGEQVLNNRNTNKALAEMSGKTNNFNVTFNNLQDTSAFAMMNQLKQYNRQMAINGVI